MLRVCMMCALMFAPAAASGANTFMRLGVATEGPRRQLQTADDVISDVLSGASLQDPVHPDGVRRAARKLHVRSYTPAGVHKVGRSLHVTHIVVVKIQVHNNARKRQMFAEMTLYDIINERVLAHQQYFLPDGKLTESTANFIVERVQIVVEGAAHKEEAPDTEAKALPARMHGHEIDTEAKSAKHADDADAESTDDVQLSADDSTESGPSVTNGESHYSVGPMLGMRHASMDASGKSIDLCYCNDGGFGTVMPGLDVRFSLFFDPNSTNFGIDAQGFVEYAATTVSGDANIPTLVHNVFWRVEGMAAYRFNLPADVALRLQLGYAYARYPLAKGAFPGLAYGAPQVGLQAFIPLGTDWLTLEAGGAFMVPVSASIEASNLGNQSLGLGGRFGGALRLNAGPVEITAGVLWDIVSLSFSGTTTLYSLENFANVSLTDQHLDVFLRVGSRF